MGKEFQGPVQMERAERDDVGSSEHAHLAPGSDVCGRPEWSPVKHRAKARV